jgi:hypothetical protein
MRELALVGLADSRAAVFELDCPTWTINNAVGYEIPRIARLFDLHVKEELIAYERWDLHKERVGDYPIYLLEEDEEMPNCVAYPRERVTAEVFSNVFVGGNPTEYYTSSFVYMLPLAILDNPDLEVLHIIGFEFGSDTEYRYQREGAYLLLGWALNARNDKGNKIDIRLPEGSSLFPNTVYGYEEYQMISRQTLESHLTDFAKQNSAVIGKLNGFHALYSEKEKELVAARSNGGASQVERLEAELEEISGKRNEAFKGFYMSAGAMKVVDYLIKECDRRAGALEFDDPLFRLDEEGVMHKAGE